jgi:hypothetical protein
MNSTSWVPCSSGARARECASMGGEASEVRDDSSSRSGPGCYPSGRSDFFEGAAWSSPSASICRLCLVALRSAPLRQMFAFIACIHRASCMSCSSSKRDDCWLVQKYCFPSRTDNQVSRCRTTRRSRARNPIRNQPTFSTNYPLKETHQLMH